MRIINRLITKNNYMSYLEIGVGKPYKNFDRIRCRQKTAVDPYVKCKYRTKRLRKMLYAMTSDDFFKLIPKNKKFDLIFIDGLHTEEQSTRDINNSLLHLSEKGIIVAHDVIDVANENCNNSEVWKSIAFLRMTRKDLFVCVVDGDRGIGIIKRGRQNLFEKEDKSQLTYEFLQTHKKKLLNLYTENKFFKEN